MSQSLDETTGRTEEPQERECVDCHELFLSQTPDLLCPRCAREAITGDGD